MKRFLTTTAMILGTAGFAFAGAEQLRIKVDDRLDQYQFQVDMNELTDAEVTALYTTMTGGDSFSDKRKQILAILADKPSFEPSANEWVPAEVIIVEVPRSQLLELVEAKQSELQIDVPLESLTETQLSQLYLIATGNGTASEKQSAARGVIY